MPLTQNWIYLTSLTYELDSVEGSGSNSPLAENYSQLFGTTFGSQTNPLSGSVVTARLSKSEDISDPNRMVANNTTAADYIRINANATPLMFDTAVTYRATITYGNGLPPVTLNLTFVQAIGSRELYLVPPAADTPNRAAYAAALEAGPIRSLTINGAATGSPTGYNGSNMLMDRDAVNLQFNDYVVSGTADDDLIDTNYIEPIENGVDRVDGGDGKTTAATGYQDDSIQAGAGNDTVFAGLGNDSVDGGIGDDQLHGGDGNDTLLGMAGSDLLYGDAGNDSLDGGDGDDTLYGGAGDDALTGGAGNDHLYGDAGNDLLTGGTGADTFYLSGANFGTDTIRGGTSASDIDTIDTTAVGGSVTVTFSANGAGNLVSGAGGSAGFTQIERIVTGSGNDTINAAATTANASYATGAGADLLQGGSGNESFDGGTGADTIHGGAGADTLFGGEGNDHLYGEGGDDRMEGGQGSDRFHFGPDPFGSDTVLGGEDVGDTDIDTIDTTAAATGNITVTYSGDEAGTLSASTGGTAGFSQIESILTGAGNDTINAAANSGHSLYTTGDGDDVVTGGSGNETITAGAGNDSVDAGAGDDKIYGGAGANTLRGGAGNDIIHGAADDGAGAVIGATGSLVFGDAGNDSIYGGAGDDTIDGGDDDDLVQGGEGNDHIFGGAGNDRIHGDGGDDTIDGGTGNDAIYGGAGADSLAGGAGTDTLEGGAGNDQLDGGADNDILRGDDGADTLVGGLGNDSLYGGNDDDLLQGGEGNDLLMGDAGNDTLEGGAGTDSLEGGAGNDLLDGGDGNDWLHGGAGEDRLAGGDGNDALFGDAGNDRLEGGSGSDQLFGGTGSDTLDGGEGNDWIAGGSTNGSGGYVDDNEVDHLTGGAGFDTFMAGNRDIITDFNTASGGNIDDGDQSNNDFVDLGSYYNAANLAIINQVRTAAGLAPFRHPLQWLRADQSDGVLDDIATANGFGGSFTMQIMNGGAAVAREQLTGDNTNVICFSDSAMIETVSGPVAAGRLRVGDLVRTRDAGPQPIRWIGKRHLGEGLLAAHPNLRPVRIAKGSLGSGLPYADLVVSPQHRMLIRSKIALRMFGADEVLAAAKQLVAVEGIETVEDGAGVTYVHFLFDAHQIVTANGAETESLHTGKEALNAVGSRARDEILAIFPELGDPERSRPLARQALSGRMARALVDKHTKKGRALVF